MFPVFRNMSSVSDIKLKLRFGHSSLILWWEKHWTPAFLLELWGRTQRGSLKLLLGANIIEATSGFWGKHQRHGDMSRLFFCFLYMYAALTKKSNLKLWRIIPSPPGQPFSPSGAAEVSHWTQTEACPPCQRDACCVRRSSAPSASPEGRERKREGKVMNRERRRMMNIEYILD